MWKVDLWLVPWLSLLVRHDYPSHSPSPRSSAHELLRAHDTIDNILIPHVFIVPTLLP